MINLFWVSCEKVNLAEKYQPAESSNDKFKGRGEQGGAREAEENAKELVSVLI